MALFLTMLPLYLFGNLHCMGMCGPLVMMIGTHKYRYYYFFGRTLSFTLAGMVAGEVGAVLNVFFQRYHLTETTCFVFGSLILWVGLSSLYGWQIPGHRRIARKLAPINKSLSLLMLRDKPLATFLFGFFTIALPCGQTIVVFSACALAGDIWVGLFNGFAFALLTSPSLLLSMQAHTFLAQAKPYYNKLLGIAALFVGTLALCRGFAEMGWIQHLVLNPSSPLHYHIVIF